MYAHSSTFYLSRSGSKLIERPSYVSNCVKTTTRTTAFYFPFNCPIFHYSTDYSILGLVHHMPSTEEQLWISGVKIGQNVDCQHITKKSPTVKIFS